MKVTVTVTFTEASIGGSPYDGGSEWELSYQMLRAPGGDDSTPSRTGPARAGPGRGPFKFRVSEL